MHTGNDKLQKNSAEKALKVTAVFPSHWSRSSFCCNKDNSCTGIKMHLFREAAFLWEKANKWWCSGWKGQSEGKQSLRGRRKVCSAWSWGLKQKSRIYKAAGGKIEVRHQEKPLNDKVRLLGSFPPPKSLLKPGSKREAHRASLSEPASPMCPLAQQLGSQGPLVSPLLLRQLLMGRRR